MDNGLPDNCESSFGETSRQLVRHEVVTHVLGTTCYLCLRAGQNCDLAEGEELGSNLLRVAE